MPAFTSVALAVGAVGQFAAARSASRAQREAQAISTASETRQNILARRRAAREERIRRARLLQAGENTGVAGSSGVVGAQSALRSNYGSQIAAQEANMQASLGISAANQRAANAQTRYNTFGSLTSFAVGFYD